MGDEALEQHAQGLGLMEEECREKATCVQLRGYQPLFGTRLGSKPQRRPCPVCVAKSVTGIPIGGMDHPGVSPVRAEQWSLKTLIG
jgi:hypothetical protein